MVWPVSYSEAVKELTFPQFKESFGKVEQFQYYSTKDWENEYEKATGKKAVKAEKIEAKVETKKGE